MITFPRLRWRKPSVPREHCDSCRDHGFLPGNWVFARESACTCGAGPVDPWTLHEVRCDTVPCPFCQLLTEENPMENRARGGIEERA